MGWGRPDLRMGLVGKGATQGVKDQLKEELTGEAYTHDVTKMER